MATAGTKADDGISGITSFQFFESGQDKASAARADGVSERNRAAIHIKFVIGDFADAVGFQFFQYGEHLNREGLSKYDMPEHYITLDAFPLTASGKILKRELVEMTKANKITPAAVRWTGSEKKG